MKPEQIEKILGLKSYSMIATEAKNRDKMIQIIADILEMSAEVSPLLKPLLERDTLIEKATNSLESAEFAEAANLFEKISDLCIELGDDSLGREFFQKAQKIKEMLNKTAKPVQVPSEPAKASEQEKDVGEVAKPMPPPVKAEKEPVVQEVPTVVIQKPAPSPIPPPTPKEPIKPTDNLVTPTSPNAPPAPPISLKKPEVPSISSPNKPMLKTPPISPPKTFSSFQKISDEPGTKEPKEKMISTPISQIEPPKPAEEEKLIDANIKLEHEGLKLNPDDFIVKQRPKTITDVPKDAKNKLKTSPFGVVSNAPTAPTSPQPVSPFKLIEKEQSEFPKSPTTPQVEQIKTEFDSAPQPKQPRVTTVPIQTQTPPTPDPGSQPLPTQPTKPQPIPTQPIPTQPIPTQPIPSTPIQDKEKDLAPIKEETLIKEMDQQQKSELEKSLMDLKIKKANLSKIALDYDMKELTGEITADELNEKKQKLEKIQESVNKQIEDLEGMLK
jgi:hypothetical protein